MSKEVLDVKGVHLDSLSTIVLFLVLLDLPFHLLEGLVVHVVGGPVHVMADSVVEVVKVLLGDHVVPVMELHSYHQKPSHLLTSRT